MGNVIPTITINPKETTKEKKESDEGETNLKLEAQKVKDFTGMHEDWQKWKNRTNCAFSGSGYAKILTDEEYATKHKRLNNVVYSQLAAATVDGTAYHLVTKYETTMDGHKAWKHLCEWYDGDQVKHETAEMLRAKIESLKLHSGITADEYLNKFLNWYRDLERIPGEAYTPSHAKWLFLKNITDPEYKATVAFCKNTNANLDACISAVRKLERDLQQEKFERRQMRGTVRRWKSNTGDNSEDEEDTAPPEPKRRRTSKTRRVSSTQSDSENTKFEGELKTTEKGLLRFQGDCWRKMDDNEKEFVRDYNAAIKHGDPIDKVTMPTGISVKTRVRRNFIKEEPEENKKEPRTHTPGGKRKKGVTFGVSEGECPNDNDE